MKTFQEQKDYEYLNMYFAMLPHYLTTKEKIQLTKIYNRVYQINEKNWEIKLIRIEELYKSLKKFYNPFYNEKLS